MTKTSTNQVGEKRDDKGRFANGNKPKVGFHTHPENRSDGGWKKEDSYSYQLRLMDRMTIKEFNKWVKKNPPSKRTLAQEKAYRAQAKSRSELAWLKEVTDRTEGKAPQNIDLTTGGDKLINTFEDQQTEILLALKSLLEGDGGKSDK